MSGLMVFLIIALILIISIGFIYRTYGSKASAAMNDHIWHDSLTSAGWAGWLLGVVLTGFYILIYWFPGPLEFAIRWLDPLSHFLRGHASDQWFLYGTLYTLLVLIMGFRAIVKYRHSNYQIVRTFSIIIAQLGFGYLIPAFLQLLNQPEFYFSYFWPLKYDYLFPSTVSYLTQHPGGLGVFMVFWGSVMAFIGTPILTYFFGKRWYC